MQLRLEREQPLTFLEFNYMILQSYDFRELYRRHAADRLQIGGSDQWGNIVCGIELTRRTDGRTSCSALTTPLIATAVGRQDGQDGAGRGVADARPAVAVRLLAVLAQHRGRRCRPLPAAVHRPAARGDRAAGGAAGAEINEAKKVLATEATAMLHGRDQAANAERTAADTFAGGGAGADLPSLSIVEGMTITQALTALRLTASNGEAKRKIAEGAVKLDDT